MPVWCESHASSHHGAAAQLSEHCHHHHHHLIVSTVNAFARTGVVIIAIVIVDVNVTSITTASL